MESERKHSIPGPFSLSSWLSLNEDKLKPPVNNSCLYSGKDFILMAVGGPNTRNDYHSEWSVNPWKEEETLTCIQLMRQRYRSKPEFHNRV